MAQSRFKTLVCTALITSAAFLTACKDNVDTAEMAIEGDPALWLVQDEDTKVYLFGTVHLLRKGMDWKTDKIRGALAESDAVYFETDMESMEDPAVAMEMAQMGMYQDGTTLSSRLTEDQKNSLAEASAVVKMPFNAIDRMEPWMAGMTIQALVIGREGYLPNEGVEKGLMKMVEGREVPYRRFEEVMEQISFFDDMDEDSQIDFLVSSLDSMEGGVEVLDDIVDSWYTGDVEKLADLMSDDDAFGGDVIRETLLTDRNANWVEIIDDLMEDEPGVFFVAVGAGHLAGEDSVITMLEDRGETVIRQ